VPFWVLSGVSRRMDVLDKGDYRRSERGSFGVNLARSVVTNGDILS